ncbi:MAG: sulfate adenylyltransferase [Cellvibrionales bacterium TMED21]|nr:sulfate adenylyltransferase [Halieaceae bacterium]MAV74178.1 sulfate adenylyltransferase [Halieaceae bacterium]OUT65428.1 MAG: sulfate adenylyltransferase [Cellvibrionales bacterium TMED21]OUT67289.1 MAG: sulfate adenylyltransferase [Cellvibrionales bacterium TMED21]|tara:strand:- start:1788 stop:2975 length:1188 start_codon:yes stop_codon:yes gene_type:complete
MLIKPHGSTELSPRIVEGDAAEALKNEAATIPTLVLSSAAAANAVMLGAGYFNPLQGYMNREDAMAVATNLQTTDGLFWPVPVLNMTEQFDGSAGDRVALLDPNRDGNPLLAVMTVEAIEILSDDDMAVMTAEVFGTDDSNHPGVATFNSQGRVLLSGPIEVLNYSYFEEDFPDTFRTAMAIRSEMESLGWSQVVAFQTRNPMHRAHEELCRMAMDDLGTDGILIHMLLGKLKAGDIPADVRDNSIRTMVDHYFPENTVMVTGYGFDMLYAGPREAVLHAVFRQNTGCSHLIVGRDHAGVGDYYGGFDAQTIFDQRVPEGALEIDIYRADHTAYSKKLDRVVMMKDAPDHSKDDFILLSGTAVREMLGQGIAPPPEFSRPEVAKILMDYYQSIDA